MELTGTATTTANAEMSVGAVTQTITVTGETPTVDVHNPTREQTVDAESIGKLPTSRSAFALGMLAPAVSSAFGNHDVGGAAGPQILSSLVAHGSRLEDQRQLINGLSLSAMVWGGWGSASGLNASGMTAITFETSAVSPELAAAERRDRGARPQTSGLRSYHRSRHFAHDDVSISQRANYRGRLHIKSRPAP